MVWSPDIGEDNKGSSPVQPFLLFIRNPANPEGDVFQAFGFAFEKVRIALMYCLPRDDQIPIREAFHCTYKKFYALAPFGFSWTSWRVTTAGTFWPRADIIFRLRKILLNLGAICWKCSRSRSS